MELKFGHRVIAWNNNDPEKCKGKFVSNDNDDSAGNWVLIDDEDSPECFDHAELDPDATEFLPGDEVEMSRDGRDWILGEYAHKSQFSVVHYDMNADPWHYCRYPRKDPLHGKTAIIDGKEYELRLK